MISGGRAGERGGSECPESVRAGLAKSAASLDRIKNVDRGPPPLNETLTYRY